MLSDLIIVSLSKITNPYVYHSQRMVALMFIYERTFYCCYNSNPYVLRYSVVSLSHLTRPNHNIESQYAGNAKPPNDESEILPNIATSVPTFTFDIRSIITLTSQEISGTIEGHLEMNQVRVGRANNRYNILNHNIRMLWFGVKPLTWLPCRFPHSISGKSIALAFPEISRAIKASVDEPS